MEPWQQKVIDRNLHALLEQTFCEHLFIGKLNHFLNLQEKDFLTNSTTTNPEKAYRLYGILKTRVNSFDGLKKALNETNQTGALDTLTRAANGRERYTQYMSLKITSSEVAYETDNTFRVYTGEFATRTALVKLFDDESDVAMKKAIHELEMLKRIDWHENIVRCFIGMHVTREQQQGLKEYFAIALDYETHLGKFIDEGHTCGNFVQKVNVLNQIWNGVIFLHSNKILHLNLKPQSVLVSRSNSSDKKVKIGEFGSAHQMNSNNTENFPLKSLEGLAARNTPEVLQYMNNFWSEVDMENARANVELNYSTDVFCLGIIVYFVLSGGKHAFGKIVERKARICNNSPEVKDVYLSTVDKNSFIGLISASGSQRHEVPCFQTIFKTNDL